MLIAAFRWRSELVRVEKKKVESSEVSGPFEVPSISTPPRRHESGSFVWVLIHGMRSMCGWLCIAHVHELTFVSMLALGVSSVALLFTLALAPLASAVSASVTHLPLTLVYLSTRNDLHGFFL